MIGAIAQPAAVGSTDLATCPWETPLSRHRNRVCLMLATMLAPAPWSSTFAPRPSRSWPPESRAMAGRRSSCRRATSQEGCRAAANRAPAPAARRRAGLECPAPRRPQAASAQARLECCRSCPDPRISVTTIFCWERGTRARGLPYKGQPPAAILEALARACGYGDLGDLVGALGVDMEHPPVPATSLVRSLAGRMSEVARTGILMRRCHTLLLPQWTPTTAPRLNCLPGTHGSQP